MCVFPRMFNSTCALNWASQTPLLSGPEGATKPSQLVLSPIPVIFRLPALGRCLQSACTGPMCVVELSAWLTSRSFSPTYPPPAHPPTLVTCPPCPACRHAWPAVQPREAAEAVRGGRSGHHFRLCPGDGHLDNPILGGGPRVRHPVCTCVVGPSSHMHVCRWAPPPPHGQCPCALSPATCHYCETG